MDKIDVIILIGRPAAGKSEIIDFLKHLPDEGRLRDCHVGPFTELEDFVYVWQTFENDDIRQRLGIGRRDTDEERFFLDDRIWDFFVERLDLDFRTMTAKDPAFLTTHSVSVEFSRGGNEAYARALRHLSADLLDRAAILYAGVSFEESVRKNHRRYRPSEAGSILYHSLEDAKMERYYRIDDWASLSRGADSGYVQVCGIDVPFAVFHNGPEKTLDRELRRAELRRTTGTLARLRDRKG